MRTTETSEQESASPLSLHHRRLETLFDELQQQARYADQRSLCECWSRFEAAVVAHIQLEEDQILPAFRLAMPDEARLIVRDHEEIRRFLVAVGVEVELHLLRLGTTGPLIDRVRAHARREEQLMYPWAERHLPHWDRIARALAGEATEPASPALLAELQSLLDEVRVKLHLGRMDAKEAYADLGRQTQKLREDTARASKQIVQSLVARARSLSESIRDPQD